VRRLALNRLAELNPEFRVKRLEVLRMLPLLRDDPDLEPPDLEPPDELSFKENSITKVDDQKS